MTRSISSIAIAIISGIAAVYLLPLPWLGPLAATACILAFIFAFIVRLSTKTELPANPIAGVLLSLVNLPEQPLAKVNEGWALTMFLSSAAFLVSLALAVLVRANG